MKKQNKQARDESILRLQKMSQRLADVFQAIDKAGAVVLTEKVRPLVNGLTLQLAEGYTLKGQHLATVAESWTATIRMDLDMGADIRTTLEARDGDPVEALQQIRQSEYFFSDEV